MKIRIDAEIFTYQVRGGISKHFSILIKYLNLKKDIKVNINSYFHCNFHLKEEKMGFFLPLKYRKLLRIYLFFKLFS